ncbi:Nucleotidyltransferase [Ramaria rubella]|nr:Nucleotidyltransferase [Ramaria rubella]
MATPTPNGKQPPRKPRHRTKPKKHAENSKSGSSSANANANPPRDASVRRGGAGPSLPKGPRSWLAKTQPQNHSDGNSRPTRSSRTSPSARQTPDRLGPSNASTSFAMGGDFIPFDFSEGEDEEGMLPISPVGKGKAPERERVIVDARNGQAGSKRHVEVEFDGDGYINKKQRTDASSRLTPWANDVEWDSCRNLAEMMHKEVEAFVAYISPTPEEHEVRRMIIELITREIQRSWPDARISPFGSYGTKLYLPLGDIDLVIESRAMENHDKKQVLYNLAQILRRAQITDKIQVIAKAKVPIVKFVTNHGRFAVDISLNQANGVKAVRIVNSMLKELPALEPLVMVIKLFLSQRSMNEVYTGGLGSYAIVCMAVSFLQMHPKIRSGEIDPSQNLGVLVIEFFELYGHYFNYDHTGISLRHGGTYFNKRARGWVDFRHPSLLSIEDPLDISNDISKNSFNMSRVRQTLAGAHEVLTAAALMRGRILTSKARGEYTDLRGLRGRAQEHDNQSILSSVMGVTQEVNPTANLAVCLPSNPLLDPQSSSND